MQIVGNWRGNQCITLVVQDWGGLLGLTLPADAGFAARLSQLMKAPNAPR